MRRESHFDIREIKTSDRNKKLTVSAHQEAEADLILDALQTSARVIALDALVPEYLAELPIDPAMMSAPAIYKGIDSAVEGFNSAVAARKVANTSSIRA